MFCSDNQRKLFQHIFKHCNKISVCNVKHSTHRLVSAARWNTQTTDAELNPLSQTPASYTHPACCTCPSADPSALFCPQCGEKLAFFLSPLSYFLSFFHPLPHLSCTSAWIFPGCLHSSPRSCRPPGLTPGGARLGEYRADESGGSEMETRGSATLE